MKIWARVLWGALLLCGLGLPAAGAAADPEVAREAARFGRLPGLIFPELSPDGSFIAALEPVNGRKALVVRPREKSQDARVISTAAQGHLTWFAWADAERLLVEESFSGFRGTPTVETRMYAVDRDGSDAVMLLTPSNRKRVAQSGSLVMSLLPDDPSHVLMSWDGDLDGAYSLYRVDIHTGRAEEVEQGGRDTFRWIADRRGTVRARVDVSGADKEVWVRDAQDAPWRLLHRYNMLKGPFFDPIFFAPDSPDLLYVLSERDTGRKAAYTVNVKTGAFGPLLFSHPLVDVEAIIRARGDGRAVGFVTTVHYPAIHYLEPALAARQVSIDAKLQGTVNIIVDESKDGRYQLVAAIAPREPGRYYIRDGATGALSFLGARFAHLSPSEIGEVHPYSYRARDGLAISAYLTLPPGIPLEAARRSKRPLVVFPHGGPNARVSQGFDFVAQFMASFGYVVLQPNFRGSTGFGHAFQALGNREWGRAMQDDLTDGARALMAEGIADPKRICIVGASYGGYAALMGAVRTPDLYACAASLEGIADLTRFVGDMRNYRFAELRVPRITDPAAIESVIAVSPLANASKIMAPVLLIHGDQDAIVPVSHSLDMARALKRKGKTVELFVLKGGDHQLSAESVRIEALARLGAFLERYLRPDARALTGAPRA